MDVRLSPEQRVAPRLGCQGRARPLHLVPSATSTTAERRGQARCRRCGCGLARAAQWWRRGRPMGVRCRGRCGRGGARPRARRHPVPRSDLATELRRAAGAPASTATETVLLTADLETVATTVDGTVPAGSVAIDAAGSSTALLLLPADGGWSIASAAVADHRARVDLTRPVAIPAAGSSIVDVVGPTQITREDLDRVVALGLAISCADMVG